MLRSYEASCGLVATISGSFHFVIAPVKILHAACARQLEIVTRFPERSARLYMNARPPALTGTYTKQLRQRLAARSACSGVGDLGLHVLDVGRAVVERCRRVNWCARTSSPARRS